MQFSILKLGSDRTLGMAVAIHNWLLLLGCGGRAFVSLTGLSVGEDKAHMPPTYHTFLKGHFLLPFFPLVHASNLWLVRVYVARGLKMTRIEEWQEYESTSLSRPPGAQTQINLSSMDRVHMIHKIISTVIIYFLPLADIKVLESSAGFWSRSVGLSNVWFNLIISLYPIYSLFVCFLFSSKAQMFPFVPLQHWITSTDINNWPPAPDTITSVTAFQPANYLPPSYSIHPLQMSPAP